MIQAVTLDFLFIIYTVYMSDDDFHFLLRSQINIFLVGICKFAFHSYL